MVIIRLLFLLLIPGFFSSPEAEKIGYIEKYKDLAIVEMHRTGIPASIILAQGLHESNAGKSNLATRANNHFGIKCKSYWTGSTYFHEDDDLDTSGRLIESCFRSYNTDIESYVDHSNFLLESAHYAKLFTLDKEDFISWAWGLKNCGYATDPKYAEKLIKIVNKYELYKFDSAEDPWTSFRENFETDLSQTKESK
jgi:flagellum-specific peptidoglycan hydrolase FlgJ